ncbi:class I SAM-dependent methyltransferase [Mycobacterium shigaense]|uniref:class I SAM-dependent methyltransferase n=1 Tax=Mycobacterium shigaense TaxID=722731 RepID=UPI000E58ABAE|nr:class I SAM-dependent methyltransferase [Mycobacterium shigaense]
MNEALALNETIATMPRGGPGASWLDRLLQTEALEYTDRDDVADEVKQSVISALDRMGTCVGLHEKNARIALRAVADIAHPRILEIGAGHGQLSAKILDLHPTATVTISDVDPTSVAKISAGALGAHPRVRTQVVDATAIAAEDDSYDLVIFALAFHHLPPSAACRAIAEATRVGKRFLVIDIGRRSPLGLILNILLMGPMAVRMSLPSAGPWMHDGSISVLRSYSRSAFVALGKAADPQMRIEFMRPPSRFGAASTAGLFSRGRS